MKKLIFILFLTHSIFVNAQDEGSCGTNTVIFASGNVSFPYGYISPTVKIGAWRTIGKVAPVISVSYQMGDIRNYLYNRGDEIPLPFNRLSLEVGLKFRVKDMLFVHWYVGLSDPQCYMGADLLFKLDEYGLMGFGWRNNSPCATVYLRLNH